MSIKPIHVVKLGGSLLDIPNLTQRVLQYADLHDSLPILLVVGGGQAADHVRRMDQIHHLGPEAGHWHAVRAMQLNTYIVLELITKLRKVGLAKSIDDVDRDNQFTVIDPMTWLKHEEDCKITTPKAWEFTSDSIAAHIADRISAVHLTLLKSTIPDVQSTPVNLEKSGIVDSYFNTTSASIPNITIINMRSNPFQRLVVRETPSSS